MWFEHGVTCRRAAHRENTSSGNFLNSASDGDFYKWTHILPPTQYSSSQAALQIYMQGIGYGSINVLYANKGRVNNLTIARFT